MKESLKNLQESAEIDNCVENTEGKVQKVAYSVAEAAIAIGVSRAFLYGYLGEHPEFPQLRLGTRIIIPKKRLEEYVNNSYGG